MTLENEFSTKLGALGFLPSAVPLAIGVSGGPDSMALLHLLSHWAQENDTKILAFTVDHGLRLESADEAKMVADYAVSLKNVSHQTLIWAGEKPQTRLLEEARAARYALMATAMKKAGAKNLFLAHHMGDQAETFLIRLAKGSGLDGLCAMKEKQDMGNITLIRPLLGAAKEDLIAHCETHRIPFVRDPTNENEDYLRPRLRAARRVLEEEGLSDKRLAVTAGRMLRAREALERGANDLLAAALIKKDEGGFLFDVSALRAAPQELVLRVFLNVMDELRHDADYAPRMERAESLLERFFYDLSFNGATLGGCIFAFEGKNERLWVKREQ